MKIEKQKIRNKIKVCTIRGHKNYVVRKRNLKKGREREKRYYKIKKKRGESKISSRVRNDKSIQFVISQNDSSLPLPSPVTTLCSGNGRLHFHEARLLTGIGKTWQSSLISLREPFLERVTIEANHSSRTACTGTHGMSPHLTLPKPN